MITIKNYRTGEVIVQAETLKEIVWQNYNFSNTDLSGLNLSGLDLSGVKLIGAKLCRADLTKANLTDADLSEATVHACCLIETVLSGVKLTRAALKLVNLTDAKIDIGAKVDLTGASLRGVALDRGLTKGHFNCRLTKKEG